MSKGRRKRDRKKAPIEVITKKWPKKFLILFLVFVVTLVTAGLMILPKSAPTSVKIKDSSGDTLERLMEAEENKPEVLATSPERSAEFIRKSEPALLELLNSRFYKPSQLYGDPRSLLKEYIKNGSLDKDLSICQENLQSSPNIRLTFIGQAHIQPTDSGNVRGSEVTESQAAIAEWVQKNKPQLIFTEGGNYTGEQVSWELLWRQTNEVAISLGLSPVPLKAFKRVASGDDWWFEPFLEDEQIAIYGMDNQKIAVIVLAIFQISNQFSSTPLYRYDKVYINRVWREQVLLANILATMKQIDKTEAVVVLGFAHQDSFKYLCEHYQVQVNNLSLKK